MKWHGTNFTPSPLPLLRLHSLFPPNFQIFKSQKRRNDSFKSVQLSSSKKNLSNFLSILLIINFGLFPRPIVVYAYFGANTKKNFLVRLRTDTNAQTHVFISLFVSILYSRLFLHTSSKHLCTLSLSISLTHTLYVSLWLIMFVSSNMQWNDFWGWDFRKWNKLCLQHSKQVFEDFFVTLVAS